MSRKLGICSIKLMAIKNIFKNLFKSQLISSSLIIFASGLIGNVGNYLYHLLMGRALGPAGYGTLVSLLSVVYFASAFGITLNMVVVKFASAYRARGNIVSIYSMFREFNRKFLLLGIATFLLVLAGRGWLASFLKVSDYKAIILLSSMFLIRFLTPINDGLLQSFLKFPFLAANGILIVSLKLGVGLFLVKMGWSVFGAIAGIVVAGFVPYLVSFVPIRSLFKSQLEVAKVNWRKKFAYAVPVFIVVMSLTSFYTMDIVLVKHFFNSSVAGFYSALGMLGKIIFFASSAITGVMFPLVVEKYESGKKYQEVLIQALILVGSISVGITAIYYIFPNFVIRLLYGTPYLEVAHLLGFFGIFISLYTVVNVLVNFFLSIHKTQVSVLVVIAALAQVGLIWIYHNSLFEVIRVSVVIMALLLCSLLLFYARNEKARKAIVIGDNPCLSAGGDN